MKRIEKKEEVLSLEDLHGFAAPQHDRNKRASIEDWRGTFGDSAQRAASTKGRRSFR